MHASNFFMNQNDDSGWFDAIVPGSSIPEWFTQSLGCSVTVELPPHRLVGLAVCVVFDRMGKFGGSAYFSMNESGGFSLDNTASMHFSKADHIWFGYQSLFRLGYSRSIDHLKVSFAGSNGTGEGVKKCGARLVFEQDVLGNASRWIERMNVVSLRKSGPNFFIP